MQQRSFKLINCFTHNNETSAMIIGVSTPEVYELTVRGGEVAPNSNCYFYTAYINGVAKASSTNIETAIETAVCSL